MAAAAQWTPPPRPTRSDGETRRVGVEIEFAGLRVPDAAQAVREVLGGEARWINPHSAVVEGGPLGSFEVELDTRYAHGEPPEDERLRAVQETLVDLASAVVPVEIVCPPIPWDRAHPIDDLCAALRRRGAEGTRDGWLYAFGLQLNVEPPAEDVPTLLALIRAFCLLRDWLREAIDVDGTRRLMSFETPYPSTYCARVLAPDHPPDVRRLIDDYLAFNPARDRELDLLPMLCMLDEARIRRRLPEEKINKRMTWHYRLPNSDFADPSWSVGLEWSRWVKVERLAEDRARLAALSEEWLENHGRMFPRDWTPRSREIAGSL